MFVITVIADAQKYTAISKFIESDKDRFTDTQGQIVDLLEDLLHVEY